MNHGHGPSGPPGFFDGWPGTHLAAACFTQGIILRPVGCLLFHGSSKGYPPGN